MNVGWSSLKHNENHLSVRQSYHGGRLQDGALDSEEVQLHYKQQKPKFHTVCSLRKHMLLCLSLVTFPREKKTHI